MQSWDMNKAPNHTANFNPAQKEVKVDDIDTKVI
jgi:hypothetical protein